MIAIKTFQDCEHAYLRPEEPGSQSKEAVTESGSHSGTGQAQVVWETLGTCIIQDNVGKTRAQDKDKNCSRGSFPGQYALKIVSPASVFRRRICVVFQIEKSQNSHSSTIFPLSPCPIGRGGPEGRQALFLTSSSSRGFEVTLFVPSCCDPCR